MLTVQKADSGPTATKTSNACSLSAAQRLNLTLAEIRAIVAVRDSGRCPCDQVKELIEQKLVEIGEQLDALLDLREVLESVSVRLDAGLREEASRRDGSRFSLQPRS
jgi:DNA-binding transcriptional MerR regulator